MSPRSARLAWTRSAPRASSWTSTRESSPGMYTDTPHQHSGRPDPGQEPALVRVEGVAKRYGEAGGGAETVGLTNASLELARGETTSLVGVSGSGKSTLLGLIAGLMKPDSGRIVIDSQDITRLDDPGRARLRARRVGVVLQSGNLIPFLTAVENVELAIRLAGGSRAARGARDLLSELGLAGRLHHLPRRLSGGEAQRVAVAVALANQPDLL